MNVLIPFVEQEDFNLDKFVKVQFEGGRETQRARLVDGRDYLFLQKGEQLPSGMKYLSVYQTGVL